MFAGDLVLHSEPLRVKKITILPPTYYHWATAFSDQHYYHKTTAVFIPSHILRMYFNSNQNLRSDEGTFIAAHKSRILSFGESQAGSRNHNFLQENLEISYGHVSGLHFILEEEFIVLFDFLCCLPHAQQWI